MMLSKTINPATTMFLAILSLLAVLLPVAEAAVDCYPVNYPGKFYLFSNTQSSKDVQHVCYPGLPRCYFNPDRASAGQVFATFHTQGPYKDATITLKNDGHDECWVSAKSIDNVYTSYFYVVHGADKQCDMYLPIEQTFADFTLESYCKPGGLKKDE